MIAGRHHQPQKQREFEKKMTRGEGEFPRTIRQ